MEKERWKKGSIKRKDDERGDSSKKMIRVREGEIQAHSLKGDIKAEKSEKKQKGAARNGVPLTK